MQRERKAPASLLVPALVGSLGGGRLDSLADLHRDFGLATGVEMDYRSFHDRLGREGFANLACASFFHAAEHLVLRALHFLPASPFARFDAVKIQDGTSFALHAGLADVFPGRFKKSAPAAVEVHATLDLFTGASDRVAVAPDTAAERRFLPEPGALAGTLLLADRGYPSFAGLVAFDVAGASFVMRVKKGLMCPVMGEYKDGALVDLDVPVPLATFLAKRPMGVLDLVVQVAADGQVRHFRLVALPTKKGRTQLLTNLPADDFTADAVGLAYRLRWQVELQFKEWKSHANLHRYVTRNAYIAEGLIWLSLLAALLARFMATAAQLVGKVAISTLKAAKVMQRHARALTTALLAGADATLEVFMRAITNLVESAQRSHPRRDNRIGRGESGLRPVFQG